MALVSPSSPSPSPLVCDNALAKDNVSPQPPRITSDELADRLDELAIDQYLRLPSTPTTPMCTNSDTLDMLDRSYELTSQDSGEVTEAESDTDSSPPIKLGGGPLMRQHAGYFAKPKPGQGPYNPQQLTYGPVDLGDAEASHEPPTVRGEVSKITDHIIQTDVWNGSDPAVWEEHKVTHVLCVMNEGSIPVKACGQVPQPDAQYGKPTRLVIPVSDSLFFPLSKVLPMALQFMHGALAERSDAVILVHCFAGISRSTACVVGYLMEAQQLSMADALAKVREVRPIACPNRGFERHLKNWQVELRSRRRKADLANGKSDMTSWRYSRNA